MKMKKQFKKIDEYLILSTKNKYKLTTFWNNFKVSVPYIFTIVKNVLVIPVTQTSSEREFSRAKLTKNDRRTRLNDEKLQKLTVLSGTYFSTS